MKTIHHGATIAVCAIGILSCLISAGVLVSELRKERVARDRLEREVIQLRQQVETLKETPRGFIRVKSTAGRPLVEEVRT